MNKKEWDVIKKGVLKFNRLTRDAKDRVGESYYATCCNVLQEEIDEGILAKKKKKIAQHFRNSNKGEFAAIELLDAWCDIVVTTIQAVDCVSPSQLEWEYCSKFLVEPVEACKGYLHTFLTPLVEAIAEAEIEEVDLFGAMKEVIRSNDSKIPYLSDIKDYYGGGCAGLEAACDYIEDSLGGKFVINYEIVYDQDDGLERVVFKDQNDKVRKPWCFTEPELAGYL